MLVKDFLKELKKNRGSELLFEYKQNEFAGTNYHLTEIKNVNFDSVDCGGKTNQWFETHFQLWESPSEIGKENYMSVDKIISIIEKVNNIKPLKLNTEIKVEYGNLNFHTSVMPIYGFRKENDHLIVVLENEATKCKAIDVCGIETQQELAQEEACCSTAGCC